MGWAACQPMTCRGVSRVAAAAAGSSPGEDVVACQVAVQVDRGVSLALVGVFGPREVVPCCEEDIFDEEGSADLENTRGRDHGSDEEVIDSRETAWGHAVAYDHQRVEFERGMELGRVGVSDVDQSLAQYSLLADLAWQLDSEAVAGSVALMASRDWTVWEELAGSRPAAASHHCALYSAPHDSVWYPEQHLAKQYVEGIVDVAAAAATAAEGIGASAPSVRRLPRSLRCDAGGGSSRGPTSPA
jgi:hypothetical protein